MKNKLPTGYKYKPLPKNVTIRESEIEGLGLFATEDIPTNRPLGVSHIEVKSRGPMQAHLCRTPLGGFINHSDEPNCEVGRATFSQSGNSNSWYELISRFPISSGEELTVDYTKTLKRIDKYAKLLGFTRK